MKTLKNKLTALVVLALGAYGAYLSDGTVTAVLTFLVFAVPAVVLFSLKKSIFTTDHADYIIKKSGEVMKK